MPAKKKSDSKAKSGGSFVLPSVVDISCAEQFLADLKELVANGGDVVLDASKVEKITTPGVQLLLATDIT